MAAKLGETARHYTEAETNEARAKGRARALEKMAERMESNRMRYIRDICRKGMKPFTRSCPQDENA